MTYYIVRHAEKEQGDFYNDRLRHQDQPISQKGRKDAQRLCAFFANKGIAAVYISGYQRTRQTIEVAAQQLGLAPIVDERLNEIDNGCIEGLTDQEIEQRFPEVWESYRQRSADFRFPEGETGEEAWERIAVFIEEKQKQHDDKNIVLVTHDGLIRLLACYALGIPVFKRWNFRVDTCGIMEIAYQPGFHEWKLIRFNASA